MNTKRIALIVMGCCLVMQLTAPAATYYVNDSSTENDIYCERAGHDLNDGLTADTPMQTLTNLVATYVMQPGDTIYMDTGTYVGGVTLNVLATEMAPFSVIGSTNGTIISAISSAYMVLAGSYYNFQHLTLEGYCGVNLQAVTNAVFEDCSIQNISLNQNGVNGANVRTVSNTFRRCTFRNINAGASSAFAGTFTDLLIENCIFLNNARIVNISAGTPHLKNNLIVGGWVTGPASTAVPLGSWTYNLFQGMTGIYGTTRLAEEMSIAFPNQWHHNATIKSIGFENADALDFHLLSNSPGIDFGDPAMSVGAEPDPHGNRMNLGIYGGTAGATTTPSNSLPVALSYSTGGGIVGTGVLIWAKGSLASNDLVHIDFTRDSGETWERITSNVHAGDEQYKWIPLAEQAAPAVQWRVISASDPSMGSTNGAFFNMRASLETNFIYYVNHDSTNGTKWCSVPGDDAATGASATSPMRHLQAVLDRYLLRGGDEVRVDVGRYDEYVVIDSFVFGNAETPVLITGAGSNTIFTTSALNVFTLKGRYCHLQNMKIMAMSRCTALNMNAHSNECSGLWIDASPRFATGINLGSTVGNRFHHSYINADSAISAFGAANNRMDNCTINAGSTHMNVNTTNGMTITNCIFTGSGYLFVASVLFGDYNVLDVDVPITSAGATVQGLIDTGRGWTNTLVANPQFVDPANGDFHLKSQTGYLLNGVWTTSSQHSPAIDFGNPAQSVGDETIPHGARINVGRFGGTTEASQSRTNAWLQVISYTDGATFNAEVGGSVYWTSGQLPQGATVSIYISKDGGLSWEQVANGLQADGGIFSYEAGIWPEGSSREAKWKVVWDQDQTVSSETENTFMYRQGSFRYYVNDASTDGDVYCTAPGDDSNPGLSPSAPKATLRALLSAYTSTLAAGDEIYVDTGVYTSQVGLNFSVRGSNVAPVRVIGSTNRQAHGSRIYSPMGITNGENILIEHLIFDSPATGTKPAGITINGGSNIVFRNVDVRERSTAFNVLGSAQSITLSNTVVHGGAIGLNVQAATNVHVRHGVFYNNTDVGLSLSGRGAVTLANSVIVSDAAGATLISVTNAFLESDYNNIYADGKHTQFGIFSGQTVENLRQWQQLSGWDIHSLACPPRFADPSNYDYHLQTTMVRGRTRPDGILTSDTQTSPLIDVGRPEDDYTLEPGENGRRVNIGRYGGTSEASQAPNTPWLVPLSFADGGSISQNGMVELRWVPGGGISGTVSIAFSVDGGNSWQTLATQVPVENGGVNWMVDATVPDTPAAVWRVYSDDNSSVKGETETFFSIRRSPLKIYVNNYDTNETIYTFAQGSPTNWQATADAPMDSLVTVFNVYDLEGGDEIYVDSGTYMEVLPVEINLKTSGAQNNPVRILGNTNAPYAMTVLAHASRARGNNLIQLNHAHDISIEGIVLSNMYMGVSSEASHNVSLTNMRIMQAATNGLFLASGSTNVSITHTILENSTQFGIEVNNASVHVAHSLFKGNENAAVFLNGTGSSLSISNNIFQAENAGRYVFRVATAQAANQLSSDYNCVRALSGAFVGAVSNTATYRYLYDWQRTLGLDMHSVGFNPQFADAANEDFHLRSQFGRYRNGVWVEDEETSPLIDLGTPGGPDNEPEPNGGRRNIGLYGGTTQASMSSATGQRIVPLTMSDGGVVRGEVTLTWGYNGFIGNEYVVISVSTDGGVTWEAIATKYIDEAGVIWDTTEYPSTAMALWKVELSTNPDICGETETYFAIKNEPLAYYVNDEATDGDVYCFSAGSATGSGLTREDPINSLSELFVRYQIDPGDTIFVDTGTYVLQSTLTITQPDASATNMLVIQGAPNGGTVFTNTSGGTGFALQDAYHVYLKNMRIDGGQTGLLLTRAAENRIENIQSIGATYMAFHCGQNAGNNELIRCLAMNFMRTGVVVSPPLGLAVAQSNLWRNGVIYSSGGSTTGELVVASAGRLTLENSVFVANGTNDMIFSTSHGVIQSDYNVLYLPKSGAKVGQYIYSPPYGVSSEIFWDIDSWRHANGTDMHSFTADPLFADPENGDWHPKSRQGRFDSASGGYITDTQTSPLIDMASSSSPWAEERFPNGGRANIGLYGNTPESSLTPTNTGRFVLMTLAAGGVVTNQVKLRWATIGSAGLHPQTIEFSPDGGGSWVTLASNLTTGSYVLDIDGLSSTHNAKWRVRSDRDDIIPSAESSAFILHVTPFTYYVNDSFWEAGDYCTAAGAHANTGLAPDSPLPSLASLLDRYPLLSGDIVYMDAGTYTHAQPLRLSTLNVRQMGSPIRIQGSTNLYGDKTVLLGAGVSMANLRNVHLSDVIFSNQTYAANPLDIGWSENVSAKRIQVRDSLGDGIYVLASSNTCLEHILIERAVSNGLSVAGSYATHLLQATIWSNPIAQVELLKDPRGGGSHSERSNCFTTVTNSFFASGGQRIPVFSINNHGLQADYNAYYLQDNALVALISGGEDTLPREYDGVGRWSEATTNDRHSLSHVPRFADIRARDFRLLSAGGRFTGSEWVLDSMTSDLVDAGAPGTSYELETAPNGARANIGYYGGTWEASRTPTSGVTLVNFNDGGRAAGIVPVYWVARGTALEGDIQIWFSEDGGSTWSLIATVSAASGEYMWDTTDYQTMSGKLRITTEDGASAESDMVFSVRNKPVTFYVNDASLTSDVYCTHIGASTNTGLSSDSPLNDLNTLLEKYDLEAGDTVLIDTGTYVLAPTRPWRITQADSAYGRFEEDGPVIFQGSTNAATGGTVVNASGGESALYLEYVQGVDIRHLVLSNALAGSAMIVANAYDVNIEWVTVHNSALGFQFRGGDNISLQHSNTRNTESSVSSSSPGVSIFHCVFWKPTGNAALVLSSGSKGKTKIRNSIFALQNGSYAYQVIGETTIDTDYNAFFMEFGSRMLRRTYGTNQISSIYATVAEWATASGNDVHSYSSGSELGLKQPDAGDFHLLSAEGRSENGTWVVDTVSSPLIDAGDPTFTIGSEQAPHGDRVNIGLYGGSAEASKSPSESSITLFSFNDGGMGSGLVMFSWQAVGAVLDHTLQVFISTNNGQSWETIATGIPAADGMLIWPSENYTSPYCLWRIVDENNPSIDVQSDTPFVLHNGPITYYVNDDFDEECDVYCTASGNDANSGTTSDAPKASISALLAVYRLYPGDVVYVDSGHYLVESPIVFGDLMVGGESIRRQDQISIIGSTNMSCGGSVFISEDEYTSIFVLSNTHGLALCNLELQGGSPAIRILNSFYICGDNLRINGADDAVYATGSAELWFSHCAFYANRKAGIRFSSGQGVTYKQTEDEGPSVHFSSGVLWSNQFGIYLERGFATVSNSIIGAVVPYAYGYYGRSDLSPMKYKGDFNNIYVDGTEAAAAGLQSQADTSTAVRTTRYATVSRIVEMRGHDAHSLAHAPELFAPERGDFHLKSTAGRWSGTQWEQDDVHSPLIDAGNPMATEWANEFSPNGRRMNIGLYGGTKEASKSTVSGDFILLSLNDGGSASGLIELQWTARGNVTNEMICLEYSPDNGMTWLSVACGIEASTGKYLWDSNPYGNSALGLWRIYCEVAPEINATSIAPFVLRNGGTIQFYVNDADQVGDVYTTAPGSSSNDGLTPNTPLDSLQAVLSLYDLDPEDIVYVDAGTYTAGSPAIAMGEKHSGWIDAATALPKYVTIQGSTNPVAPTIFKAPAAKTPILFDMSYTAFVLLRDFTLQGGLIAINDVQTEGNRYENLRLENAENCALFMSYTSNTLAKSTLIWNAATNAISLGIQGSLNLLNCVIWGDATAVTISSASDLTVTNTVLRAAGANARIYRANIGSTITNLFSGDYNDYVCIDSAIIAEQVLRVGGSEYFSSLNDWSGATGVDWHSMMLDPQFAESGQGDFHPQSEAGRFYVNHNGDEAFGEWVTDYQGIRSPLIDAGAIHSGYSNEPIPNGNIVNIGIYGNTPYASKTPTNTPWVQTISYNAGETMSGMVLLYWVYGGLASNEPVEIAYSTDEVVWIPLSTNSVGMREYLWDTSAIRMIPKLKWRVRQVSFSHEVIQSISQRYCSLKNGTFTYYVNDDSQAGDVWSKNPGVSYPTASGTNAQSPVRYVHEILENYPVGAGDTIYVDTGHYDKSFVLGAPNAGLDAFPLQIVGSTNGSIFYGFTNASAVTIQNTRNVVISNLTISGGGDGIILNNASDIELIHFHLSQASSNGIAIYNSSNVKLKNIVSWNNHLYGCFAQGSAQNSLDISFATIHDNGSGSVFVGSQPVFVSNSILSGASSSLFTIEGELGSVYGDYNIYHTTQGNGALATNRYTRIGYSCLTQWQEERRDVHSLVFDPFFVDPINGDLHLKSQMGVHSATGWTMADETSWGIDFGNPDLDDYRNELTPNGMRVNVGAYGGTDQASKSYSGDAELLAITARDGGILTNGVSLRWTSRGIDAGTKVRILYFNGESWVELGICNIEDAYFIWDSDAEPAPEAKWRIELVDDTAVCSESGIFSHRPRAITYYVNDDYNPLEDIYTTASGSPENLGYRADSPLDSIQAVLNRFQLLPGDKVLVDTGTYILDTPISISATHSGSGAEVVTIMGSTNLLRSSSILVNEGASIGFDLMPNVSYIVLSHFGLRGFDYGVRAVERAENFVLQTLDILNSRSNAISVTQSAKGEFKNVLVQNSMIHGVSLNSSREMLFDSCVFWNVQSNAFVVDQSSLVISNSVLEAGGAGAFCYALATTSSPVVADFNAYYIHDAGNLGQIAGLRYESLPQWVAATKQDAHSLSGNPLFAQPEAGDFHLQSLVGRYSPAEKRWVTDEVHSPLIDAGYKTNNNYSFEPPPHGARRNIGLYGNTPEASLSNTNAWLLAISAMDGGLLRGNISLHWNYGGDLSGGETGILEYSPDNGTTWELIVTRPLSNSPYLWPSAQIVAGANRWLSSPGALWRISVEGVTTNTTALFGLRNEPFKYYLNDDSTDSDVWCMAVGNDDNLGYWAFAPKRTLSNLLASVDAEPGDTIYIDTGDYTLNLSEEWSTSDAGDSIEPLRVLGSTNGTRIRGPSVATGAVLQVYASYLDIRNLNWSGYSAHYPLTVNLMGHGIRVNNHLGENISFRLMGNDSRIEQLELYGTSDLQVSGTNNCLTRVEQIGANIRFTGSNHQLLNSLVHNTRSGETGVWANVNGLVMSNNTIVMPNSSAVALLNNAGTYQLRNNILIAGGTNSIVLDWRAGNLDSDWNNLLTRNHAWIGQHDGTKWERLAYWQKISGQDANSLSLDPIFVNEGGADFHLQSSVGAWDRGQNAFLSGVTNSPLIDAGNPQTPYSAEVLPNGGRINMGAYGGTKEASLSRMGTNWVQSLAPSDGGVVKGSNVVLRWNAALGHTGTVALEYWDGTTWVEIVNGLSPSLGSYFWETADLNLFATKWRVVDSDGNISECVMPFDIRNQKQQFFITDETVEPGGYTTAPGSDLQDGLTPETPKRTLQAVLDAYDLEGGDTVYVDRGTFVLPEDLQVVWSRSGTPENPVVIQGWSNSFDTVLTQAKSNTPMLHVYASDISFRDLKFSGRDASYGLYLDQNSNVLVQAAFASDMNTGLRAQNAKNVKVRNSGFFNTRTGVQLVNTENVLVANNTFVDALRAGSAAISLQETGGKGLTIKNNIYHMGGEGAVVYRVNGQPSQLSRKLTQAVVDYNLYSLKANASEDIVADLYDDAPVVLEPPAFGPLLNWQLALSNDFRSAYTDARLPETLVTYALDFHPLSEYGRYTPGGWEQDDVTSFAIDHGDPSDLFDEEQTENGGRINIGMYGNTPQASKGSEEAYYETRTLSDVTGGTIKPTLGEEYVFAWDAHLYDSNTLVTIVFWSGSEYLVLASGISATQEYIIFALTQEYLTQTGKWRVYTTSSPNEFGESLGLIDLREGDPIITSIPTVLNGRIRFTWKHGVNGKEYWILYSDDHGQSWKKWSENENGPAFIHQNHFILSESRFSYTFEDRTAYNVPHRWYRIIETEIGGNVDEYISNPED